MSDSDNDGEVDGRSRQVGGIETTQEVGGTKMQDKTKDQTRRGERQEHDVGVDLVAMAGLGGSWLACAARRRPLL